MQRLLFMRLRRIAQLVVLAAVVLIAAVTAGVLQADGSSASTPPAGDHGPRPALVTAFAAWDGVNYTASCSGCLPPDAQVASGGGYVFEMVNASYEIWTAGGTLVMSNTLDVLFNAGSDLLADPQLRFDSTVLRWFATVDDLHNDQILYASSESSDPTGGWYLQHFNIAGGNVPRLTSLGLDSLNLVVATNVYSHPKGAFLGTQVWVANKTQLMGGGGVSTWTPFTYLPDEALVPAEALTSSKTMYLVSDGTGNTTSFNLFTLTGSPPGTPTLSAPVAFSTTTTTPPNATQAGSANLVSVGDGRVESAVWRAGDLWAAATDGCKPPGDTVLRSCLHLWQIATATSTDGSGFRLELRCGELRFLSRPFNGPGRDPDGRIRSVLRHARSERFRFRTVQRRRDRHPRTGGPPEGRNGARRARVLLHE